MKYVTREEALAALARVRAQRAKRKHKARNYAGRVGPTLKQIKRGEV